MPAENQPNQSQEVNLAKELLDECERFIEKWRMTPSTFGKLAMDNDRFISRLRGGLDIRISSATKARNFMLDYERKYGRPAKRSGKKGGM